MRRPACQVARRTLDSSTRCRLGVGVGARRSRGSPVEGTGGSLVVGMLDTSSAVGSRHSAMLCVCFEWRAVPVGAAGRSGTADWWGAPAPALHAGPPGVSSWAYRKGWFRRTHLGPWRLGRWGGHGFGRRGARGAGTALVAQSQSYQGGLGTQPRSASETQNSHPSSPGPTRPSNTILFSLKKQRCFRKCWLQFEKYSFYLIHRR